MIKVGVTMLSEQFLTNLNASMEDRPDHIIETILCIEYFQDNITSAIFSAKNYSENTR